MLNPPGVMPRRLQNVRFGGTDRFVKRSVVELNDLSVFDDGLRNPQVLAEASRDSLGDRRLAVTRKAVEKQPGKGGA